jgi:hypothetical protein
VHGDGPVPLLLADLEQPLGLRDAGVVHEDVDALPRGEQLAPEALRRREARHVALEDEGRHPGLANERGRLPQLRREDVHEGHGEAVLRQRGGGGAPDAARGARHHRDPRGRRHRARSTSGPK